MVRYVIKVCLRCCGHPEGQLPSGVNQRRGCSEAMLLRAAMNPQAKVHPPTQHMPTTAQAASVVLQ